MPRYIIKVADRYMEYSTIVDAVVSVPMSIHEFKEYYLQGTLWFRGDARVARAPGTC